MGNYFFWLNKFYYYGKQQLYKFCNKLIIIAFNFYNVHDKNYIGDKYNEDLNGYVTKSVECTKKTSKNKMFLPFG